MKKSVFLILICAALLLGCLAGCGASSAAEKGETQVFTDSCGRDVELPINITSVAPSGTVATMVLAGLAPDKLVSVSASPSSSQMKYLPEQLITLPTTGQLYGSKSTMNYEALIAAGAQVIIDIGDPKDGMAADLNELQRKTGIPVVFIRADLTYMAEAYRTLGGLLDCAERGEAAAEFIDRTLAMAEENSAKVPEEERLSVMYTSGTTGLNTNAEGSTQAQVLPIVGAINAIVVEEVSNKGGGNTVNMEQLYVFDPDCIVMTTEGPFETMADDPAWSQLRAVRDDMCFEIPGLPYNWLSGPPSVNMVIGVWWLGNLLYPEAFDYDMTAVAQEYYSLFWDYELTDAEAQQLLANSTLKRESAA